MKLRKYLTISLSISILLTISTLSSSAITPASDYGSNTVAKKSKPRVVIIKAEWCSACQKVDPIMMGLMKEYGDKLDFVMLDVTSEESTAQAAAKAKSLGLSSFFEANKKMTSTVAVFKGNKSVFKTAKNFNRDDYVRAFEEAVK